MTYSLRRKSSTVINMCENGKWSLTINYSMHMVSIWLHQLSPGQISCLSVAIAQNAAQMRVCYRRILGSDGLYIVTFSGRGHKIVAVATPKWALFVMKAPWCKTPGGMPHGYIEICENDSTHTIHNTQYYLPHYTLKYKSFSI